MSSLMMIPQLFGRSFNSSLHLQFKSPLKWNDWSMNVVVQFLWKIADESFMVSELLLHNTAQYKRHPRHTVEREVIVNRSIICVKYLRLLMSGGRLGQWAPEFRWVTWEVSYILPIMDHKSCFWRKRMSVKMILYTSYFPNDSQSVKPVFHKFDNGMWYPRIYQHKKKL